MFATARPSPLLYVGQRSLQYFPERRRTAPQAVGLPEAEEAVLDTADGDNSVQVSSSTSAFAPFRSSVSKPSVNQPQTGASSSRLLLLALVTPETGEARRDPGRLAFWVGMETRASATWGDYKRWCSADYAVSNWTKISSRITVMSAAFADTRKALGLEADHALMLLVAQHVMGLGQRGVKSRTVLYLLTLEEFRSYRQMKSLRDNGKARDSRA